MKSTGIKKSAITLDSLTSSVDRLIRLCSTSSDLPITTVPTEISLGSYAEKLAHEHNKIMGSINQASNDLLKQFSDPPVSSVLKLELAQILETNHSQKQLWEAYTQVLHSNADICSATITLAGSDNHLGR